MRFVSPLLQTTSQSKGEPAIQIKWLNSPECYVLSLWRMPSWFVLISEYKSMGNKARGERGGSPALWQCAAQSDHSVVWHNWCCFFLLSYITDHQSGGHIRDLQQVWQSPFFFLILRSPEQTEPNLLHIRNDLPPLPLSAPNKPITRQIIFGDEKSPLPLLLLL